MSTKWGSGGKTDHETSMTQSSSTANDQVSALMDGELQGSEREAAIVALLGDPDATQAWHAYHWVGDALRSEELAAGAQDLRFLAKLEMLLSQETKVSLVEMPDKAVVLSADTKHHTSANSDRFRWRMAAGGAMTVALAVLAVFVGWVDPWQTNVPMAVPMAAAPQKLQNPVTDTVAADGMIRDPRLDQLLSAHQQLGGHSALQMPSGFLRNATFDAKGR
ncbi:MAG: sigma-E factor negative regulatory protein [Candidatus Saccharibacteria bacterium]|nr:sigma-E factor negative regulatory protein [Rhodoferax sp.]